ncbi:hypothetical protein DID78_02285 [Candidatus Marinamargulisbacteria bacterium SCGC AG-343-D04]|nr:hypothetical protein DID78_02285 [Candidatus Marinamargulisbacteria bacterium SCGC AG-343-D04]
MKPALDNSISLITFESFYWLKSELQKFCKEHNLNVSGSKKDLEHRICHFLNPNLSITANKKHRSSKQKLSPPLISLDQKLGKFFKFGRESRAFFLKHCSPTFSFNVEFMNWVKNNPSKTLKDAILQWKTIRKQKKVSPKTTKIGQQFEYNQYTRDFFIYAKKNSIKTSKQECIKCWNYKKKRPHKPSKRIVFEPQDLTILNC